MAEEIAQHSFAPVPDPTVLTTQQLQREIAASRDLLDVKIDGLRSVIDTRLSAADQTITLLRFRVDQIPENIHQAIERTQELRDEKFKSIAIQFLERDTRTEQQSRDAKVAVDAALQAAKEAVGEQNKSNAMAIAKSEATFTKQIDQIGVLVTTMSKAIDDKIDDIKTRIQMIEGSKKGASDLFGVIFGIIGIIVGIGGVALAAIFGLTARNH